MEASNHDGWVVNLQRSGHLGWGYRRRRASNLRRSSCGGGSRNQASWGCFGAAGRRWCRGGAGRHRGGRDGVAHCPVEEAARLLVSGSRSGRGAALRRRPARRAAACLALPRRCASEMRHGVGRWVGEGHVWGTIHSGGTKGADLPTLNDRPHQGEGTRGAGRLTLNERAGPWAHRPLNLELLGNHAHPSIAHQPSPECHRTIANHRSHRNATATLNPLSSAMVAAAL